MANVPWSQSYPGQCNRTSGQPSILLLLRSHSSITDDSSLLHSGPLYCLPSLPPHPPESLFSSCIQRGGRGKLQDETGGFSLGRWKKKSFHPSASKHLEINYRLQWEWSRIKDWTWGIPHKASQRYSICTCLKQIQFFCVEKIAPLKVREGIKSRKVHNEASKWKSDILGRKQATISSYGISLSLSPMHGKLQPHLKHQLLFQFVDKT